MTTERISDDQCLELMDGIADLCDQMDLAPEQILDGIARSLLGATSALGTNELSVSVEGFGSCNVTIDNKAKSDFN